MKRLLTRRSRDLSYLNSVDDHDHNPLITGLDTFAEEIQVRRHFSLRIPREVVQGLYRQQWQTGHAQFLDHTPQAQLQATRGGCHMLLLHLVRQDKATLPRQELEHFHISRAQHLAVHIHHNTNTTIGYRDLNLGRSLRRTPTVVYPLVALGGNQHLFPHTRGNSHIYRPTEHQCFPTPSSTRPIYGPPDMSPSWKLRTKQSLPQGAKACLHTRRIHPHCQQVPHTPTYNALLLHTEA